MELNKQTLTIKEERVLNFLKKQQDKFQGQSLAKATHCGSVSSLRRCVKSLRQKGQPICSDRDGYYYSTKPVDLRRTKGMLTSISSGIENTCNNLENMAKDYEKDGRYEVNRMIQGEFGCHMKGV